MRQQGDDGTGKTEKGEWNNEKKMYSSSVHTMYMTFPFSMCVYIIPRLSNKLSQCLKTHSKFNKYFYLRNELFVIK